MALRAADQSSGLYSYGLYSYGLYNCGLNSYGLYSYGRAANQSSGMGGAEEQWVIDCVRGLRPLQNVADTPVKCRFGWESAITI